MSAQSRVDPQTIAIYAPPPDPAKSAKDKQAANACSETLPDDKHQGAIDLDCFVFPEDRRTNGTSATSTVNGEIVRETAYRRVLEDSTKRTRNRLAAILIKHADDVCTLELGRLTANEATVNTALSILTSAFSSAGALVQGETAKSILAGLATTTNASRGHINAEVYRNALSTAVSRAIINARDKRRGEIEISLTKPNADYNVDQMIVDVNNYHQLCSFYRGLALVVDAVDRTKLTDDDRQASFDRAISAIDTRIVTLTNLMAHAASDERPNLVNQIQTLRDQQTTLWTEMTAIKAAADPADK